MTETNRPIPGVLYGITHSLDGQMIIREQKLLKIGIGLPKGPAINVWIDPQGNWKIRLGYKEDADKVATLKTRAAAEKVYAEKVKIAPVCPYPRKIGYFTFTREVVNEDGRTQFVPDFDAIEAHGPCPTEIDVVLVDDTPFRGGYQMWSQTELQCYGDGVNAMRIVKLAATPDERAAANLSAQAGERYFPIAACWTGGCPYAEETEKNGKAVGSACKPGGDLRFQLACNIRIGGTAYFHTTGRKSIQTIFSSLYRIGTLTGGRLVGIPLKMTLRPFKTNHNGQVGTQFAVGLEFRAPDPATLSKRLMESVFQFHALPAAPVKMIESADAATEQEIPVSAAGMAAEYYPEAEEPEWADEPTPSPATVATEKKTEDLADRLRQKRERGALAAEQKAAQLAAEAETAVAVQQPAPLPRDEEPPF